MLPSISSIRQKDTKAQAAQALPAPEPVQLFVEALDQDRPHLRILTTSLVDSSKMLSGKEPNDLLRK